MEPVNLAYKGFEITTDKSKMQLEAVHKWLSESSYWAKNTPFDLVETAFNHSFCIAILKDGEQVGYARLFSDYATFGYLADVYVKEEHRGIGLSKKMMEILMNLDWVKRLRRIMLATQDAQGLYRQFGFTELPNPERFMVNIINNGYPEQPQST
jgi:GNAT superfamily N-acetyltransferase